MYVLIHLFLHFIIYSFGFRFHVILPLITTKFPITASLSLTTVKFSIFVSVLLKYNFIRRFSASSLLTCMSKYTSVLLHTHISYYSHSSLHSQFSLFLSLSLLFQSLSHSDPSITAQFYISLCTLYPSASFLCAPQFLFFSRSFYALGSLSQHYSPLTPIYSTNLSTAPV